MQALKITQGKFDRSLGMTLKWKLVGSRKKYFLTEDKIPKDLKSNYDLVEFDDEAQQVEEVLGDITNISGMTSDELNAARLDNLKARTKLIEEKLENRKQELWAEWNEAFFEAFTEAFSKFKNDLISLHLGEEQLSILTEKLENALSLMQDKLDAMWNKFTNEEEEQGAEK